MGIFDSFMTAANNMMKKNYRSATGHDFDRDFRTYISEWEWRSDEELKARWRKLAIDDGIRHAAEKRAVMELMKEKGFDTDDY